MKKFIVGVIFGVIISSSISAFANSDLIAKIANFNILVNGEKVAIKSSVVTIDGSTYLPMRELANILDYDVSYEAVSKTIKLSNTKGEKEESNQNNTNENDIISIQDFLEVLSTEYPELDIGYNKGVLVISYKGIREYGYLEIESVIIENNRHYVESKDIKKIKEGIIKILPSLK